MATFSLGNVPSPINQALRLAQLREAQNPNLALERQLQQAIQLQQLQQQSPEGQLALQQRQAQLNSALESQAAQQQQQAFELQRQPLILEQLKAQLQRAQDPLFDEENRFNAAVRTAVLDPNSGVRLAGAGAPPAGEIEPLISPKGVESAYVLDLARAKKKGSPFQSVGLTTTPGGVTQGVVFDPTKGDFETRDLPTGVTDIRAKVTAPPKAGKAAGGLTANQQSNLRLRGARSFVDINEYTDPETGVVDWNLYTTKVGEAEGNTLHANNLIKNARASVKTTLDEKNLQIYGNRMAQANTDFDRLTRTGFDPTSLGREGLLGGWSPNLLKTDERQQYEQAERNFINSTLRRESGAVITDDEFLNARRQYFPQPGDGEGTLTQKAANRKLVVDEFIRLGGQSSDTGAGSQTQSTQSGIQRNKGESTADYLKRKYNR